MRPRDWFPLLAYGALAAALLASLWLVSLAPMRSQWGRELTGAAVAIVAMAIGLGLARRPTPRDIVPPRASTPAQTNRMTPTGAAAAGDLPTATAALSLREREVLRLLAQGLSNKELARELSVTENTVKTHLANLYAKLGVRRRTEALAAARRLGLDAAA